MVPLGVLLVILGTILRGILYIHKLPINRKAADTCMDFSYYEAVAILSDYMALEDASFSGGEAN